MPRNVEPSFDTHHHGFSISFSLLLCCTGLMAGVVRYIYYTAKNLGQTKQLMKAIV
jgi:hypothetical protein